LARRVREHRSRLLTLALGFAVLGCGLSSGEVVRVWVNRTETPIEVQEAIVPSCSTVSLTQAEIDAGLELRRTNRFPAAPPGTVPYLLSAYNPDPGMAKPFYIVVLAGGVEEYHFGSLDEVELPPCAGRAAEPTYPGSITVP
jgi:hypothetical protein